MTPEAAREKAARALYGEVGGPTMPVDAIAAALLATWNEAMAERDAEIARLTAVEGEWTGHPCAKCGGVGRCGPEDARCHACAGTGDEWLSWKQRAEAAESALAEAREALMAIRLRCYEGDKRVDWLPTIAAIASAQLKEVSK